MCTGKIRALSQLGAEKIAFLYFYISAFCSLTDRPIRCAYMRGMNIEFFPLYLNHGPRKTRYYIFTFLPFVAWLTERRTKYFYIDAHMRGMCTEKFGASSQLGAEKIAFPPIYGWRHTDGQTDEHLYL